MKSTEREKRLNDWLSRHKGLVLKVVRSFATAEHDQEDLFQEIAFQLWNSLPRYKPEVAESTWMYRVSLYTAINWSRRERIREERIEAMRKLRTPDLADAEGHDARVDWLYEQISQLDPVDRSVALLLLDGFSYREMSETLGMSESNVGVRINRIKKKLTQQLQREQTYEL